MDASAVIEAMRACGHSDGEILAVVQKLYEAHLERKRAVNAARQRAFKARQAGNEVTPVTPVTPVTRKSVTEETSRGDIYTTRAHALIPVGLSNDNPPIVNPLVVPQPEETAPRKASRAKPRTRIAENQLPTEADARNATERGLSQAEFLAEWRRFKDFHRAKGSTMADWQAAWRTWLNNRERFAQPRAGPPPEKLGFATMLVQSIERQNGRRKDPDDFENLPALSFGSVAPAERETGANSGLSGGLRVPDG